MLVGEIARVGDNSVELSARLLSADDSKKKALSVKATFQIEPLRADLSSSNSLAPLPSLGETFNGERLSRATGQGVELPSCFYLRNPPYTQDAKHVNFSGVLLMEGIVATDGHVRELRVVKGLPYGLKENALKTMETWRCKAATREGKPVPTIVTFEVSFRLTGGN